MMTTVSRDEFMRLIGLNAMAFHQRAAQDQIALAFGREVPSEKGQYLALDAVAMELDRRARHARRIRRAARPP
jgi:hypothetical protein